MEFDSIKCRICLKSDEKESYIQIYENVNKIGSKILQTTGVQVIECGAVICHQCNEELDQAWQFRQKCIKADKIFRSQIPKVSKITSIDGDQIHLLNLIASKTEITSNKTSKIQTKQTKEKFFCSKCFKLFYDKSYLKKHEYYRHSIIPAEKLFECDFCGHNFKSKQLIQTHLNLHSSKPKDKWICKFCGKLISTKGNLESHEKTHRKMDLSDYFECSICQKKFREKRFMTEHKKLVHEKLKTFKCLHCDHISTCKGAYNIHFKSVHLKLRDHLCSECGSKFSTNSQLVRHIRIHTNEKPFNCSFCAKPFRLSSHKNRHEIICPKNPEKKVVTENNSKSS